MCPEQTRTDKRVHAVALVVVDAIDGTDELRPIQLRPHVVAQCLCQERAESLLRQRQQAQSVQQRIRRVKRSAVGLRSNIASLYLSRPSGPTQ